jgi:hypothetical protein
MEVYRADDRTHTRDPESRSTGLQARLGNRRLSLAPLLGILACITASAWSFSVQAATVDAIWKTHRVTFQYSSRTTAYSCSGLTAKVKAILRRVGAHQDITVIPSACDDASGLVRLDVEFRAPVQATVASISDAVDYDAREVLAARLRGERLAAAEDIERFAAEWETIALARDRRLNLAPGDCDLLRQILHGLFSRMSVQVTRNQLRCSAAFGNAHPPRLTIAALVRADLPVSGEP